MISLWKGLEDVFVLSTSLQKDLCYCSVVVDCPTQLTCISMILHLYLSVFHDKSQSYKYEIWWIEVVKKQSPSLSQSWKCKPICKKKRECADAQFSLPLEFTWGTRLGALCGNVQQLMSNVLLRQKTKLSPVRAFPFFNLGEMHQKDLVDYQPCE